MATDNAGEKDSDKKKLTGNFEISIKRDEKTFKCVISNPNRFVIQAAMAKMIKSSGEMDMVAAGEIVYNSCKISGDKEIDEDERLLVSVFLQCAQAIEIAEAEIKKI